MMSSTTTASSSTAHLIFELKVAYRNLNERKVTMHNQRMIEAIRDCTDCFFSKSTMDSWNSEIEYGMLPNNTFVTSEDNFNRTKKLYSVRLYDWDKHSVETITFQQHRSLSDAIRFAEEYEE